MTEPHPRLIHLVELAKKLPRVTCVVAHPCSEDSLEGAIQAKKAGLIEPILVGPQAKIARIAESLSLDLSDIAQISASHSHESAEIAVEWCRTGKAAMLMKGSLHTDELMGAVVDHSKGLRTERRLSHVYAIDIPAYFKLLLITDAAINIQPNLEDKADILRNAIVVAQALGVSEPKVAILAAVETVTPKMPSTIDAAALCKMADRGQIRGALVDGPLAFDNAIDIGAAQTKEIISKVAGQADVLLVPDLEAGNMLAKQLFYFAGAIAAGVVMGATVPIILTSRAESAQSRLASAALARLVAG